MHNVNSLNATPHPIMPKAPRITLAQTTQVYRPSCSIIPCSEESSITSSKKIRHLCLSQPIFQAQTYERYQASSVQRTRSSGKPVSTNHKNSERRKKTFEILIYIAFSSLLALVSPTQPNTDQLPAPLPHHPHLIPHITPTFLTRSARFQSADFSYTCRVTV